jgi:hypothetical protein
MTTLNIVKNMKKNFQADQNEINSIRKAANDCAAVAAAACLKFGKANKVGG